MSRDLTITLVDGVKVVVPDRFDHVTPFVLQEQGDWFEDEIRFLRKAMRPGQLAVDIGANYGLYTLSLAKAVGPQGHVWAFEPAASTHAFLTRSVQANRFTQVTVERSAMSDHAGTGHLAVGTAPELNALAASGAAGTEEVPLVTLDDRMEALGWTAIDFLKVDAEGVEHAILAGGQRFLRAMSPLVQVELRTDAAHDISLIEALERLDYRPHRVVPGLDLLVPLDAAAQPDQFLLNALCCKADRAAELAAQGRLVLPEALPAIEPADPETLYRRSRESGRPPAERLALLQAALAGAKSRAATGTLDMSLTTLACAARDAGERMLAVNVLIQLMRALMEGPVAGMDGPFVLPCERYLRVSPGKRRREWALACVVEGAENIFHFSAYYDPASAVHRLHLLKQLGFLGPEMSRRLQLLKRLHAQQQG